MISFIDITYNGSIQHMEQDRSVNIIPILIVNSNIFLYLIIKYEPYYNKTNRK